MEDPSVCNQCGGLWYTHFAGCLNEEDQWEDISGMSECTASRSDDILPVKAGNGLAEIREMPVRISRADRAWLGRLEETIRDHMLVDSFNTARRCVFCGTHIDNHQAQCREVENKISDIMTAIAAQL